MRTVTFTLKDIVTEDGLEGVDIDISPTREEILRDLMEREPTPALDYAHAAIMAMQRRNEEINAKAAMNARPIQLVKDDVSESEIEEIKNPELAQPDSFEKRKMPNLYLVPVALIIFCALFLLCKLSL